MFRVLDAHDIHMHLTESLAMTPAASVSGFDGPPESAYFNVGKIGRDQMEDWALRTGHSRVTWGTRFGPPTCDQSTLTAGNSQHACDCYN